MPAAGRRQPSRRSSLSHNPCTYAVRTRSLSCLTFVATSVPAHARICSIVPACSTSN